MSTTFLQPFLRWLERRRARLQLIRYHARMLIEFNERSSYCNAQRLAVRYRGQGSVNELWHWSRVAAEIARTSSIAEMNGDIVSAIADDELNRIVRHNGNRPVIAFD